MKTKMNYQIKKIHYEKTRDKLLQKQNNRYKNHKNLLRSYAESENRLKKLSK